MIKESESRSMFGIDEENLAHIFGILRSGLYSNKIKAVLREYFTNAFDANVENGKGKVPVEIKLPTYNDPSLSIRDFGKGLSEEEVYSIYTMYGTSTKRGKKNQTGQLGIGSKSAFAYGDTFNIVSYYEGKENTYHAYLDETGVGAIERLPSKDTTEETGIKIVVPIKKNDIQLCKSEAEDLFVYASVPPKGINIKKIKYTVEGKGWGYKNGDNRSFAIMGNIPYLIDQSNLSIPNSNLLSKCDLYFNLGDVDFTSSRENLRYTEKTINAIAARILQIKRELQQKVDKSLENCKNWREAWSKYSNLYNTFSFLPKNIVAGATYKGKKFNKSVFDIERDGCIGVQFLNKSTWNRPDKSYNHCIFINDVSSSHLKKTKAYREWRKKQKFKIPNRYFILYPISECDLRSEVEGFLEKHQITGHEVIYISDIPESIWKKPAKTSTGPKTAVKTSTYFEYNWKNTTPYSTRWDEIEDKDVKDGIVVHIDRYLPVQKIDTLLSFFREHRKRNKLSIRVIGTKDKTLADPKAEDKLRQAIIDIIDKNKDIYAFRFNEHLYDFYMSKHKEFFSHTINVGEDSPMMKFKEEGDRLLELQRRSLKSDIYLGFIPDSIKKLYAEKNPKRWNDELTTLSNRYPLLESLFINKSYYRFPIMLYPHKFSTKDIVAINRYINLIDDSLDN